MNAGWPRVTARNSAEVERFLIWVRSRTLKEWESVEITSKRKKTARRIGGVWDVHVARLLLQIRDADRRLRARGEPPSANTYLADRVQEFIRLSAQAAERQKSTRPKPNR